jgi:hypothetical protein
VGICFGGGEGWLVESNSTTKMFLEKSLLMGNFQKYSSCRSILDKILIKIALPHP